MRRTGQPVSAEVENMARNARPSPHQGGGRDARYSFAGASEGAFKLTSIKSSMRKRSRSRGRDAPVFAPEIRSSLVAEAPQAQAPIEPARTSNNVEICD